MNASEYERCIRIADGLDDWLDVLLFGKQKRHVIQTYGNELLDAHLLERVAHTRGHAIAPQHRLASQRQLFRQYHDTDAIVPVRIESQQPHALFRYGFFSGFRFQQRKKRCVAEARFDVCEFALMRDLNRSDKCGVFGGAVIEF